MAPKERNERIIQGNYERLKEEEKKRAVKLNEAFYFFYPLTLAANKFKITPEREKEKKKVQMVEDTGMPPGPPDPSPPLHP